MSSQRLRSDVLLFWQIDADLDDLYAVSCNYVAKLCQGLFNEPQQLNAFRWQHALSFTKYVTIDRTPPTEDSCRLHILRAHLQVNIWQNLKT